MTLRLQLMLQGYHISYLYFQSHKFIQLQLFHSKKLNSNLLFFWDLQLTFFEAFPTLQQRQEVDQEFSVHFNSRVILICQYCLIQRGKIQITFYIKQLLVTIHQLSLYMLILLKLKEPYRWVNLALSQPYHLGVLEAYRIQSQQLLEDHYESVYYLA